MKIAVIYNRESQKVINLFGIPNREKYGKKAIKAIKDGLRKYGHQVKEAVGLFQKHPVREPIPARQNPWPLSRHYTNILFRIPGIT